MTTLEILWIIGTILMIWFTVYLIEERNDGSFMIPLLFSLVSLGWMIAHFYEYLSTPLW